MTAASPQNTALPLTVIGGFLGAGKTTLVRHLLLNAQGRRICVLVNDFGALNIDAALIASAGGDTVELSNGCVCCTLGDDLFGQLIEIEKRAGRYDHIVIEASGISDPWKIAQIGLAASGYRLDGVIVMIDAATAGERLADTRMSDSLLRQCRNADLLLLNKCDCASAAERAALRAQLLPQAPKAAWLECAHAALPVEVLLAPRAGVSAGTAAENAAAEKAAGESTVGVAAGGKQAAGAGRAAPSLAPDGLLNRAGQWRSAADDGPAFHHATLQSTQPWDRARLQPLLGTLPQTLLRGKAIIPLGTGEGWLEWHRVGRRESWRRHAGAAPMAQAVLVLIDAAPLDAAAAALASAGWRAA